MDARPLRDLLADLVGDAEARQAYGDDPSGYLAANGHPDLPSSLLSSAVVAYADTAPVEVASALAPYVAAHGPVPDPDADAQGDWFEALTSASPVGADTFGEHLDAGVSPGDWSDPAELDFGAGAGSVVEVSSGDVAPVVEVEEVPVETSEPEWPVAAVAEPPVAGLPVEADDDDEADDVE